MGPFAWLIVALVMAIAEIASFGLITIWFVVGSLVAFVASLLGADLLVQIIMFLAVSVLCLIVLRPVFIKYRQRGQASEPTKIGQSALVVETVDNGDLTGRVETEDRVTWAARSADGSIIPEGTTVVVVGRESVKLIVERKSV